MVTITEDYVSFETAKLLREKGFKGNCIMDYIDNELINVYDYDYPSMYELENTEDDVINAPTLQMAMKWLREACGLIISIEFQAICPTWKWRVYIKASNKKHTDFQHYNKYEEACEAAIKYCLELI